SAAWTSIGMLTTTGRRSVRALPHARTTSSTAVSALPSGSESAPTDSASPPWSMRKLECRAPAAVSPAITSSGVRLLAASASPDLADRPGYAHARKPTAGSPLAAAAAFGARRRARELLDLVPPIGQLVGLAREPEVLGAQQAVLPDQLADHVLGLAHEPGQAVVGGAPARHDG